MEKKQVDTKVLKAAKKWAKDFGWEILRYAGEEDSITYFNANDKYREGIRYLGMGSAIAVDKDGNVTHIRDNRCIAISNIAAQLGQTYDL